MNADNRKEDKWIMLVDANDEDSKVQMPVIQSQGVVCQKCFEPCRIEIKNYKIWMYDCINKYVTKNMKLVNYKNTQMVDQKGIILYNCKKVNLFEAYNNIFYICLSFEQKLYPIGKSIYDKSHNIVDYNPKKYCLYFLMSN